MNTKLILVEGIPGSGKSTFAKKIADFYTGRGLTVNLYNEGGYHPADLAWNACVPIKDLDGLLAPYQSFRAEIDRNTHPEGDYAVISYPRVTAGDDAFYREMEAHEVYDGRIPFEQFRKLLRQRWRAFGEQAEKKEELTVFECAFLQNQVSELRNFQLAGLETMKPYFRELLQAVEQLSPFLVYLTQTDVRNTLERTARERVFEGGSWIEGFIGYSESTPYGKAHGVKGMDGVARMLEERQRLELELLRSLPLRSVVLENRADDWEALWERLAGSLPV